MSVPLTSLTQKPVEYNTFSFGGDDTPLGHEGVFGAIAEWDLHPTDDCFKANFVFFVKKAFAFLDFIGIGTCFFGSGGFVGKIDICTYYQNGPSRNQQAREKIVTALGGEEVCRDIPVVTLQPRDFTDYMHLGESYFRSGQWVVQGEDPAGRKFVLLRIADRTGQVFTATIHQRYRETSFKMGGGSLWTTNIHPSDRRSVEPDTDMAADFVKKVRTMRHREFTIAMKP